MSFLCDPNWNATDRSAEATLQQSKVGRVENRRSPSGWLCIPTGGSGGWVRFARHDERTLAAAVMRFLRPFRSHARECLGVLPPHHVSGLMATGALRSDGGEHSRGRWKHSGARRVCRRCPDCAGDVGAVTRADQLQRLLNSRRRSAGCGAFACFLGGGPVWPQLADAAARAEDADLAQLWDDRDRGDGDGVAPGEFLAGGRSSGTALPHARVTIAKSGVVRIAGESVFCGYFPNRRHARNLVTEDLGRIDQRGFLTLLGRRDAVIISGGKKVSAGRRGGGASRNGSVFRRGGGGRAGPGMGPRRRGLLSSRRPEAQSPRVDLEPINRHLSGYQRPKRFVAVAKWPRNAQGKLDRAALRAAVVDGK